MSYRKQIDEIKRQLLIPRQPDELVKLTEAVKNLEIAEAAKRRADRDDDDGEDY